MLVFPVFHPDSPEYAIVSCSVVVASTFHVQVFCVTFSRMGQPPFWVHSATLYMDKKEVVNHEWTSHPRSSKKLNGHCQWPAEWRLTLKAELRIAIKDLHSKPSMPHTK